MTAGNFKKVNSLLRILHNPCLSLQVERKKTLSFLDSIARHNEQLYSKLTSHMFDVYNDAKHGKLSAWSCMAK